MKFTQWVIEWSANNPRYWLPVTLRKKGKRHDIAKPLMADTKKQALWLLRNHKRGDGITYRVRNVTFKEIAQ